MSPQWNNCIVVPILLLSIKLDYNVDFTSCSKRVVCGAPEVCTIFGSEFEIRSFLPKRCHETVVTDQEMINYVDWDRNRGQGDSFVSSGNFSRPDPCTLVLLCNETMCFALATIMCTSIR